MSARTKPDADDGVEQLVRSLFAAHLHPDPAVRAARLAAIERSEAERRARYAKRIAEAQAECDYWAAVCERLKDAP